MDVSPDASQHVVVLGLGSNLGSREGFLRAAIEMLEGERACRVMRLSRMYETEPLGPPQPHYFNAAVRIETALAPHDLLALMHHIERALGRKRREKWAARTIDIDILWMDEVHRSIDLEVPHPQLERRTFALAPLLDVAPELGSRYGPVLEHLGGAPHRQWELLLPRPYEVFRSPGKIQVEVHALDEPDAIAALATALATELDGLPLRTSDVRSLHANQTDASLLHGVVDALLEARSAAFRTSAVALCSLHGGFTAGYLVGEAGAMLPLDAMLISTDLVTTPAHVIATCDVAWSGDDHEESH